MRTGRLFSSPSWQRGCRGLVVLLLVASGVLAGCRGGRNNGAGGQGDSSGLDTVATGGSGSTADTATGAPDTRFGQPALAASQVPPVYLAEWQKAENRSTCALIAPAALGDGVNATPRAATFSGGWAVAYDLPDLRSAFGVAGSGATTSDDAYSGWTNRRDWPDGSFAEYGPEGGQGPNQLAYLRVTGQGCLYNVWSRLGLAHLELLLDQLRRVNVPPG